MFHVFPSNRYKKSLRKMMVSGGFDYANLSITINMLSMGMEMPTMYKDHQLNGDLGNYRECHVKSDLLLIYEKDPIERKLILVDIGSHSDLFG
ncbi:TPA: type II toxin-antitoxin system mRNA interferase toxin, RelE/StbE family [Candidatus Taylorbacteria bacterium]|nr:type II toxin-antitoxin system mRNA interferase toxin, RelE/StbE family [Candidatus Taylorbacteria bacterium]